MRGRKIIIGVLTIIALLVACVLVVFTRQTKPLAVAVAFAGYTNDMNGARVAVFTITNEGPRRIRRWDRYRIETQEQARLSPPIYTGQNVILSPGQSEEFRIPTPTNHQLWRVVFSCSPYGTRQDFADWANRSGYWRYLPKSLRGVPSQYAKSDWIKE